ncbi:hypothetical protein MOQ72_01520 [Saccharopolyspora sp. K220]|uniref:hypothetical protein n=1 Tax=Saccharopolyspora soli TaxID=2926618 RepID=UPI001F58127B|nr:hypothetical protein [Saccharopolyspora soli]MCI2416090.1 hypothetical protein [Saccharopolyspora soli]
MIVIAETAQQRWIEDFRRITNEDPEIQAHGRHYTCAFLIDMAEHCYLIRMSRGHLERILVDPGPLDERYEFAIRASAETWRKFAQPIPEPMYHGIFAASFRRDMRLDGDLLVLMQNLRCVVRHLELLRSTGSPV